MTPAVIVTDEAEVRVILRGVYGSWHRCQLAKRTKMGRKWIAAGTCCDACEESITADISRLVAWTRSAQP